MSNDDHWTSLMSHKRYITWKCHFEFAKQFLGESQFLFQSESLTPPKAFNASASCWTWCRDHLCNDCIAAASAKCCSKAIVPLYVLHDHQWSWGKYDLPCIPRDAVRDHLPCQWQLAAATVPSKGEIRQFGFIPEHLPVQLTPSWGETTLSVSG